MIELFGKLVSGFVWGIAGSVLLSALTILSAIGLMGTSAFLIVQAGFHPSVAALQVAIVGVRFFGISRAVFRYLERLLSHSVNLKILAKIRLLVFSGISKKYPFQLSGFSSASLLSLLVQDIEVLENLFVRFLLPILSSFIVTIVMSVIFGIFSPETLAVYLTGFILVAIILPISSAWLGQISSGKLQFARVRYQEQLIEFLQAFQESIFFGETESFLGNQRSYEAALAGQQWQQKIVQVFFSSASFFLIQLTAIATIWMVLSKSFENERQIAGLAAVYLMVLTSFEAVQNLPAAASLFGGIKSAIRQIIYLDEPENENPEIRVCEPADLFPLDVLDISFRYPNNDQNTLTSINFTIMRGQKIAIVGPSGSGKSTLLNFLCGLFKPNEGQIRVGGIDLAHISKNWLFQKIGFLSGDPYLFATSVEQNIQLANESNSNAEIEQIIMEIGLANRFSPQDIRLIGEHGDNLSRGEAQRVAIGRLLARESDLYLIDEPFKNIDAKLATNLAALIQKKLLNKSVLWVTHQIFCMEYFDLILVLENGKIIERGRHQDLLRLNGYYAQLVNQNRLS